MKTQQIVHLKKDWQYLPSEIQVARNSVKKNKQVITEPLEKFEVNTCKTCGNVTKLNLPYCSTDCTYWPHLRKKVIGDVAAILESVYVIL